MTKLATVHRLLQRLSEIADWKFAIGVRIRFANPTLLYQTYPQGWIDFYNQEGLIFVDPTVKWAIMNDGICDWSDLTDVDSSDVLGQSAQYGLKFGKVVSIGESASRTIGFFAHASRKIDLDEIQAAQSVLQELHQVTEGIDALSDQELAALRALNFSLNRD